HHAVGHYPDSAEIYPSHSLYAVVISAPQTGAHFEIKKGFDMRRFVITTSALLLLASGAAAQDFKVSNPNSFPEHAHRGGSGGLVHNTPVSAMGCCAGAAHASPAQANASLSPNHCIARNARPAHLSSNCDSMTVTYSTDRRGKSVGFSAALGFAPSDPNNRPVPLFQIAR